MTIDVETYRDQGYLFPLEILSREEAGALRAALEAFEAKQGGPLRPDQRNKMHLVFRWLADPHSPSADRRCPDPDPRRRHPLLEQQLLHQGAA